MISFVVAQAPILTELVVISSTGLLSAVFRTFAGEVWWLMDCLGGVDHVVSIFSNSEFVKGVTIRTKAQFNVTFLLSPAAVVEKTFTFNGAIIFYLELITFVHRGMEFPATNWTAIDYSWW